MKAILDTNVIISMLLSRRGTEAWVLHLWRRKDFDLVVSPALFDELLDVLERPHISKKVDYHRRLALFRRFRESAIWTPGEHDAGDSLPDPNDDFLISAALEAGASFVVTWDQASLQVGEVGGIRIVNPEWFIAMVIRKRS